MTKRQLVPMNKQQLIPSQTQQLIHSQALEREQGRTVFELEQVREEIVTSPYDGKQYVVQIDPRNEIVQQPVLFQQVNHFHADYNYHDHIVQPSRKPRYHRPYYGFTANKLLWFAIVFFAFLAFLAVISK